MGSARDRGDGREARFLELFDAHYGKIVAFGMRRGLMRSDAEDLAAEVFLTGWRRLDSAPAECLPWLYGIAHRCLGNQRRAGGRRLRLQERLRGTYRETQIDHADSVVGADSVVAVLARLSDTDRDILRLVAWEGLDPAGAGVVLGCSATAARLRLHRARKQFARALAASDRGEERTAVCVSLPEEMA